MSELRNSFLRIIFAAIDSRVPVTSALVDNLEVIHG